MSQVARVLIPSLFVASALALHPAILEASESTLAPGGDEQASSWHMPRTEFGHPDLQGTWFFGSRTPLQRPRHLADQRAYGVDEVDNLEAEMRRRLEQQDAPLDPNRGAPESGAQIRQEADDAFLGHYLDPEVVPIDGEYRTSVIIDPPNGRLPLREGFVDYHGRLRAAGLSDTDGPEGQPLSGRCLIFGAALPSLTPMMMNPNLVIVQTGDYVVIMTEMIHDARIIPLHGEHRDDGVQQWMGESIGRWEGDTLVVHSKNFRPEQSSARSMPISEEFEVIERYSLAADDVIRYEFTVYDEQAFTRPVTGVRALTRNAPEEQVYEFGCHEGNYSLPSILRGARVQEVAAEQLN